ncbi:MAG: hypothetical protein IJB94_06935 [Clostridia bacterium]|nr:hypothetical protein [Clostridia bacterium]
MQKEGKKERGGWLAAGMDGVMAQRIGRYLLLALLGALLTSAPLLFGVHPFGIALIAAAGQAAPACALGAVAYSLLTKEYMTLIAVLAVILVRVGVAFFGSAPSSRTTAPLSKNVHTTNIKIKFSVYE